MGVLTTHGFPEESFTAVPDGANLAGDHLQITADLRTTVKHRHGGSVEQRDLEEKMRQGVTNRKRPAGRCRRCYFRLRLNEYTNATRPPSPASIAVDGSGTDAVAPGTVNSWLMPYTLRRLEGRDSDENPIQM